MEAADIRTTREALTLTQAQFAQLLGVHWVTVSKWERGEATPPPYQAGLISKFREATVAKKDIGLTVAEVLVTAGVVAAIFLILSAVFAATKGRD